MDMLNEFDVGHGFNRFDVFTNNMPEGLVRETLRMIAYHTVGMRHFGGDERKLYTKEIPEFKDQVVQVDYKVTVRTGKRMGPSGWGEDYEPGYLYDTKSHVLLGFHHACDKHHGTFWIEKTNVELQLPSIYSKD